LERRFLKFPVRSAATGGETLLDHPRTIAGRLNKQGKIVEWERNLSLKGSEESECYFVVLLNDGDLDVEDRQVED